MCCREGGGLRWLPTEGMADKGTDKQRRMKNHQRDRPSNSKYSFRVWNINELILNKFV